MGWPELAIAVLGSGGLVQLLNWWSTRGRSKADTAAVQVDSALRQLGQLQERYTALEGRYEKLEAKYDRLEEERFVHRRSLYAHQLWDLEAHQKAVQVDPEFPLPPELSS